MDKKEIYGKSIIKDIIPIQKDVNAKQYLWTREIQSAFTMSIGKFETCQCNVEIFSTPYVYRNERIYIVVSIHKKDGKELIRFGNRKQVQNIIDGYNFDYIDIKKPEINW